MPEGEEALGCGGSSVVSKHWDVEGKGDYGDHEVMCLKQPNRIAG